MEEVNELKFVKQIFIQPNQVKSRNNCYICIYKILPKSITGNMPKLKTVIIAFGLVCAAGATMAAPLPRQKGCHAQTCRNRVMDSDDFAILYNAVKNQSFKDRQIDIIKIGALGTSFSPSQCLSLMNLFSFDDDKMQVLELMAPGLSEYYGEDTEIILDAFSFPSSKEKACKILLRHWPHTMQSNEMPPDD